MALNYQLQSNRVGFCNDIEVHCYSALSAADGTATFTTARPLKIAGGTISAQWPVTARNSQQKTSQLNGWISAGAQFP